MNDNLDYELNIAAYELLEDIYLCQCMQEIEDDDEAQRAWEWSSKDREETSTH